jgi:hypothetical protein
MSLAFLDVFFPEEKLAVQVGEINGVQVHKRDTSEASEH